MSRFLLMGLWFVLTSSASAVEFSPYPFETVKLNHAELKDQWPALHDISYYPYPTAQWVASVLPLHTQAELSNVKMSNDQIAEQIQKQWLAFFRGDFAEPIELLSELGILGLPVALYSQAIYATYLESNENKQLDLLYQIINLYESHSVIQYQPYATLAYLLALTRLFDQLPKAVIIQQSFYQKVLEYSELLRGKAELNAYAYVFMAHAKASLIRRFGKMSAQLLYNVNKHDVFADCDLALQFSPDSAWIRLEIASINLLAQRKRDLGFTLHHVAMAINIQPKTAEGFLIWNKSLATLGHL